MTTRRVVLLLPAVLAARCGKSPPPPPPPPVLELSVHAGPDQNPGPDGKPGPVAVRLYQLRASAAFERADWYVLTEREHATLGDDVASMEEFVLLPGETRTMTRPLKPGVQFVGVAAAFRDIDRASWRGVQPVTPSGTNKLVFRTAGTNVTLAPG